jgi:pimeloyl-ACP methyl ester carboxylesterase
LPVVDVNNFKVSYEESGDGLPLVFIPGIGEPKECFRRQIMGLSQKYRVIACDLRPAGLPGNYTVPLLAADLYGFMQALRLHNAVVCGHSFGGMVAQEFAITYPHKTSALALISTFPTLPDKSSDRILSWFTQHPARGSSPIDWLRGLFGGKRGDDASLDWPAEQAASISKATIDAQLRLAQSYNSTDRLGAIGAPTLVIVGEKDREEIQRGAQELYENIGDSALEVIEGGDHFCFFHRHDLVNAALDDFITANRASIS